MGYSFTWTDIEKICKMLGMERHGKTSVWKGIGADGLMRSTTIHAKHKGSIGAGLVCKIAKKQDGCAFRDYNALLCIKPNCQGA